MKKIILDENTLKLLNCVNLTTSDFMIEIEKVLMDLGLNIDEKLQEKPAKLLKR
jgi:hypothetical protein